MPILCFEGPSAVGKTTTAAALRARTGTYVVPEVNVLFRRPASEAPAWYFERQAERWALALDAARESPLVVLDGDPFQPLWYNWAYTYAGWQRLDFIEGFYRPRIVRSEMSFPDRYIVFGASEAALRAEGEGPGAAAERVRNAPRVRRPTAAVLRGDAGVRTGPSLVS